GFLRRPRRTTATDRRRRRTGRNSPAGGCRVLVCSCRGQPGYNGCSTYRGRVDAFTLDDVLDQVVPDRGRRFGLDRIHVIPEALGVQGGRRGGWEMSPQDGLAEPVPQGSFAAWADRPVDRGDCQVLTGSQSLSAF